MGHILLGKTAPAGDVRNGSLRIQALELCGDMTGEGRQHRAHAQLPLPPDYLLLQSFLAVYPALRQRAVHPVYVAHAVPGQMRRTGEPGPDFLVRKPVGAPDLLPYGLLPRDSQGQVDTLQGHPVYQVLPFPPAPPGHGVAEGAVVQEEAFRHQGPPLQGFLQHRHGRRQFHGMVGIPRNGNAAAVGEIAVKAHGHGRDAATAHVQLSALHAHSVHF